MLSSNQPAGDFMVGIYFDEVWRLFHTNFHSVGAAGME